MEPGKLYHSRNTQNCYHQLRQDELGHWGLRRWAGILDFDAPVLILNTVSDGDFVHFA